MLSAPKHTGGRQPRKWTVAEDQKLREEVEAQMSEGEVKDWCKIAAQIPGRTNKDCRKRWTNSVAGGLKKGQWSKSEDLLLERGVHRFGQRWVLVAETVQSRSADQCAKRWQQSLDPDLDRSEWRDSEDQVLIQAVQKLGRHWKDIQRDYFRGRSKNCIKNRYTVLVRRFQNKGITLPEGTGVQESASSTARSTTTYSTSYDENMSDMLEYPQPTTQVSTPASRLSWSLEDDPVPSWATPESFDMPSNSSSFSHTHTQSAPLVATATGSWPWPATTMGSPSVISLQPVSTYPTYSPATTVSYSTYGTMQSIYAPTSAPLQMPYQDPETLARYMRYRAQTSPPYQMQ
ncbi:hypothetical protein BDV96DRAFT_227283 [Lophiotrema nucula]|uniref:Homeodomain-like protein n=1 Tax=Lophiotrema nucula TaxID=690887 RepID=A0A6A5YRP7_9PLEO|nr:hypothetical protein BDV96DRAFT_227283 [Lophiotrema nucula]